MRRLVVLLAALALLLVTAAPASANNDPHRFFLPQGSMDFAAAPNGPCAFAVHLDTLVDKEYGTQTTLADGSTLFALTGSMTVRVSANGKALDLNVSGPARYVFAPDGKTWSGFLRGQVLVLNPTPTAMYPSGLVLTSGLWDFTAAAADNWTGAVTTSTSHMGHLEMDVCAALS